MDSKRYVKYVGIVTGIVIVLLVGIFMTHKLVNKNADTGLRHLLNLKLPTSRRNAVFFCQILPFYLLYGVVFYLGLCYNRV